MKLRSKELLSTLFCLVVVCSGCAGSRPPERASYDLQGAGTNLSPPFAVVPVRLELRMASWLDSTEMNYRLTYDTPTRLRQYAESRWAGRSGLLANERLQALFGPVASSSSPVRCLVRIEITEFAQHFVSSTQSAFVLEARWSVNGAKGERLMAKASAIQVEAASADARGGVAAAAQATDQLGAELLKGVQSLAECL